MRIPRLPDVLNPCCYGYHLWHKHAHNHNRKTGKFTSYRECWICKQKQIKEDIHNVPPEAVEYHEGTWRNLK